VVLGGDGSRISFEGVLWTQNCLVNMGKERVHWEALRAGKWKSERTIGWCLECYKYFGDTYFQ
jgi:hypothetical protein